MTVLENKFNEEILKKYRRLLFPVIGRGVITGYNVYVDRLVSSAPYVVNYLHADLGFDENGVPHRHREELVDILSRFTQLKVREKIVSSVTDRVAVYKIGEWEENPEDLKFYDPSGNYIPLGDLPDYEGILIAEGKQFDLGIEIENQRDLQYLLNLLNKYVYAIKVNQDGKVQFGTPNPNAVYGAWEIPLLVITGEKLKRRDYRRIFDIVIVDDHEISTLIRKQLRIFEDFLQGKDLFYTKIRKSANRPFVELYLDEVRQS